MHLWTRAVLAAAAIFGSVGASSHLRAQTVQPVISEYTGRADGFFEVINGTTKAQIVTMEPKSFDVTEDGQGQFRPLDNYIQVDLSATSVRLEPLQTARVFYKVRADHLPAWVCIYSVFSPAKRAEGINLRVMLPHTVYVYQKEKFPRSALDVSTAQYDAAAHKVNVTLRNTSDFAVRAEQVSVTGAHAPTATQGGFPLLPHGKRTLSLDWTDTQPPRVLAIRFPSFDVKVPVAGTVD